MSTQRAIATRALSSIFDSIAEWLDEPCPIHRPAPCDPACPYSPESYTRRAQERLSSRAVAPTDAEVEAVVEALRSIVPNTDGVLWGYTHEDTGEVEPVTLTYAARAALTAAREARS